MTLRQALLLSLLLGFAFSTQLRPIRAIKRIVYGTVDSIAATPQVLQQIRSQILDNAIATKSAFNSTYNGMTQIPGKLEAEFDEKAKATKKATEELTSFINALPAIVDANVKMVQAIPSDVLRSVNSTIKYAQHSTIEAIERTINFPTYVLQTVNSTTQQVMRRTKAVVMAPFLFVQKVQRSLSGLAQDDDFIFDEERLRVLEAQAASRIKRAERLNSLRSAKETVYRSIDTVEDAVAEAGRSPEKLARLKATVLGKVDDLSASYRAVVSSITSIPDRARAVQQSLQEALAEVKRSPLKVQKAQMDLVERVEAFKVDMQRSKAAAARTGEYLWRVVTLEEAKAAVKELRLVLSDLSARATDVQTKLADPSLLFKSSKPKKRDGPLAGVATTLTAMQKVVGASVDAVSQVGKTAQNIASDEYCMVSRADKTTTPVSEAVFLERPRNSTALAIDPAIVTFTDSEASPLTKPPTQPLSSESPSSAPPTISTASASATGESAIAASSAGKTPVDANMWGVGVLLEGKENQSTSQPKKETTDGSTYKEGVDAAAAAAKAIPVASFASPSVAAVSPMSQLPDPPSLAANSSFDSLYAIPPVDDKLFSKMGVDSVSSIPREITTIKQEAKELQVGKSTLPIAFAAATNSSSIISAATSSALSLESDALTTPTTASPPPSDKTRSSLQAFTKDDPIV